MLDKPPLSLFYLFEFLEDETRLMMMMMMMGLVLWLQFKQRFILPISNSQTD